MDNYYDPPQENIHYLRFNSADEIKVLMENCSEEKMESNVNGYVVNGIRKMHLQKVLLIQQ